MSPRVIIFGLDGATYTVLDDLVRRGVMPCLGELLGRGVRGQLRSTVPPLTPPAWTTLVTGRSPGAHGIFNFLQFDSATSPYLRIISSREIRCETIWSMANRGGLRAGSLNFVAHSPAFKLDGYVIPGWVPWRWVKKHSHPADLVDRLKRDLPGFDVQELAMNFKEEEKAVAGAEICDYEPWIDLHIRRERQWFNVLRHQMRHDPCALTGIVFDGVDKLQHLIWQFIDPALEPAAPSAEFIRTRERCWDYFRQLDGFFEETVRLAGPDGYVLVASDHGFCGTTEVVYINTWLEREGYLTWLDRAEVQPAESRELGEAHPYHLTHLDMTRTRAFATSASSNGIHIQVAGVRGAQGIAPEQYESFREELVDALLTRCVDPASGEPLIKQVWTREQAFAGPNMALAPDLTVALRDHGFFSVLRSDAVVKPRPAVMGCHHPEGVFLALGPQLQAGARIAPVHLLDIAPTVLHLLGLPVPRDLEGRVIEEMFSPEYRADHRVAYAASGEGALTAAHGEVQGETDGEGQAQLMMRLRALGYVE